MKIIAVDNFDREIRSDEVIAENLNDYYAKLITRLLNAGLPEDSDLFFRAVENDYKLYIFEP